MSGDRKMLSCTGGQSGARFVSQQRGYALVTVLVAAFLIAAIAYLTAQTSAIGTDMAVANLERDDARYVAEAGMQHALWLANRSACANYADLINEPFGGNAYTTTLSPDIGSPISVQSVGTLANGTSFVLNKHDLAVHDSTSPVTIQLLPDAEGKDTFIEGESGHTGHNKGNDKELRISAEVGKEHRSLLQFDLSAIPSDAKVQSATLELTVKTFNSVDPVEAHRILRDWTESEVTWDRAGVSLPWAVSGGDYYSGVSGSFLVDSDGTKSMDVTALVAGWVGGAYPNHGLILRSPTRAGAKDNKYYSGDDSAQSSPRLSVTYLCACGSTCQVATASQSLVLSVDAPVTLGGSAVDNNDVVDYLPESDTASLLFDGSAVGFWSIVDALHILPNGHYVLSTKDDTNLGGLSFKSEDLVKYDPATDTASMFMDADVHFDILKDIISLHILQNGNVVLSTDGDAMLGGVSFDINDLVEYDRITGNASLYFDGDTTTFSGKITALHVLSSGNLVLTSDGSETLGGLAFSAGQLIEYDPVTDNATLYFDGDTLFSDGSPKIMSAYVSNEDATLPGPKHLLFVVSDINGPGMTVEEQAYQSLVESWGYVVETIDDDATQAEFDAAVANNDVLFMTNDIVSSTLDTKLVDAAIGIVMSEVNLADEFGMASTIGWDSGTAIEINDNTHYITSPFALGLLTILSSNESLAYVSGTVSDDLRKLASSPSGFGIVTLHSGAALYGGGTAAGRRVQLPWGGSPAVAPGDLTPDGTTILKRALEWGAGASSLEIIATDGTDDAEEWTSDGTMLLDSSDLELADNSAASGQPTDIVGIRFPSVPISQGQIVAGAYIQFQVDEPDSGAASLLIEGEAVDDALPFAITPYDISSRVRTVASAAWSPPDWMTIGARGSDQRTVNIATVVQEIVDRPGWVSGNALAVIISGSGVRTAEAYEGDPGGAPTLHVEFGAGGPVGYYLDEFNAVSYAGNDGTLDWSDDWQELGESNGPASGRVSVVASASQCMSGGCLHIGGDEVSLNGLGLSREADLDGASTAQLTFTVADSGSEASVHLDISDDGGSNWTRLHTYVIGSGIPSTPTPQSFDISAFASSNTRIRFIGSGSPDDAARLYIDDVKIDLPGGGGGGGGGGPCDGRYADWFEQYQFDNSDGSLDWTPRPWQEIGESDGPTSGDIRISSDLSSQRIRIRDNDNGGEGVEREADLAGAATAVFSYDYRRSGLDSSSDYVTVEISANGAAGPWTELARYEGPTNDGNYVTASHDISSFAAPNTRIRLKTSPNMGGSDIVWFDNVELACTP